MYTNLFLLIYKDISILFWLFLAPCTSSSFTTASQLYYFCSSFIGPLQMLLQSKAQKWILIHCWMKWIILKVSPSINSLHQAHVYQNGGAVFNFLHIVTCRTDSRFITGTSRSLLTVWHADFVDLSNREVTPTMFFDLHTQYNCWLVCTTLIAPNGLLYVYLDRSY